MTSELKSLVGWGLRKHCLTRPTLRGLVHVRHPGVEGRELAQLICKQVEAAAWKLQPTEARAALVLLRLSSEATHNTTINRELAIAHLGLHISVETFRRPFGPELDLMQKLAEALEEAPGESWVAECEVVSQSPLELRLRLRRM